MRTVFAQLENAPVLLLTGVSADCTASKEASARRLAVIGMISPWSSI